MGKILYFVAIILILAWAIGFIGYNAPGIIHVLLVIAFLAVVVRLTQAENIV